MKCFTRTLNTKNKLNAMAMRHVKQKRIAPPRVDGHIDLNKFDTRLITKQIPLTVAWIKDPTQIGNISKQFGQDLLQVEGLSNIVQNKNKLKGLLLKEEIETPRNLHLLAEETKRALQGVDAEFEPYTLTIDHKYWRTEETLAALLPKELHDEIPCAFTIVGHVAHLNIKERYSPYRFLIGQVVKEKNPNIRTVVNKIDSIGTKFRTFDMEVLAGDGDMYVEQHESNCRFKFDFSKVYWNSRLNTEHERLVSLFRKGEAVCDVMAGVGPFACPAAKKGVFVQANDLNPHSYKYLTDNIKLNRVQDFVTSYNEDGATAIRRSVTRQIEIANSQQTPVPLPGWTPAKLARASLKQEQPPLDVSAYHVTPPSRIHHYVMNLPDSAMDFLSAFNGLYSDPDHVKRALAVDNLQPELMPMIHVHCFHKFDTHVLEPNDPQVHSALYSRLVSSLNFDLGLDKVSFHKVRHVAPTKYMYCVSFRLPVEVARGL